MAYNERPPLPPLSKRIDEVMKCQLKGYERDVLGSWKFQAQCVEREAQWADRYKDALEAIAKGDDLQSFISLQNLARKALGWTQLA